MQFVPDGANVEQGGFGRGIDQDVEVAGFGVFAPQDGAEHARIAPAVAVDDQPDGVTVGAQDVGWFHGGDGTANAMPLRAAPGARSSPRG